MVHKSGSFYIVMTYCICFGNYDQLGFGTVLKCWCWPDIMLFTFAKYSIHINALVVVVLLFYVHDKHLMSCRDGQLT